MYKTICRIIAAVAMIASGGAAQGQAPSPADTAGAKAVAVARDTSGFWLSASSGGSSLGGEFGAGAFTWSSHRRLYVLHFLGGGHLNPYTYTSSAVPTHEAVSVRGVQVGRSYRAGDGALRAQAGLAYAERFERTDVVESTPSGLRVHHLRNRTLAHGVALTGTAGADWVFSRFVWIGVEATAVVSPATTFVGGGFLIGFGLRK